MIVAKPVVPDQYWILKRDDRKVGNIQTIDNGYAVSIDNNVTVFKTMKMLRKEVPLNFEQIATSKKTNDEHFVHGFHTSHKPYNSVFDVKHQLPLWTKEPRSRSWHAAGWYRIKLRRDYEVVECPKLIMLERYKYQGPFFTKDQAEQSS